MNTFQKIIIFLLVSALVVGVGFLIVNHPDEKMPDAGEAHHDFKLSSETPTEIIVRTMLSDASTYNPDSAVLPTEMSEATFVADVVRSDAGFAVLKNEMQRFTQLPETEFEIFWSELQSQGYVGEWETVVEELRNNQ